MTWHASQISTKTSNVSEPCPNLDLDLKDGYALVVIRQVRYNWCQFWENMFTWFNNIPHSCKAKQIGLRFGAALYSRAIAVDADTFFCTDEVLRTLAERVKTANIVSVSRARTPKCSELLKQKFPDIGHIHEVNSGVLGLRITNGTLSLLER